MYFDFMDVFYLVLNQVAIKQIIDNLIEFYSPRYECDERMDNLQQLFEDVRWRKDREKAIKEKSCWDKFKRCFLCKCACKDANLEPDHESGYIQLDGSISYKPKTPVYNEADFKGLTE